MIQRRILLLLLLFFGALALRLAYFAEIRHSPLYLVPVVDARTHHEEALRLLGDSDEEDTPYWKAPLYPWLLAGIYHLAGPGPTAPRIFQFLLGCLSAILVFHIARRVFESPAAWLAAAITAGYPLLIYFEGQLLIPPLAIFLNLSALLALLRGAGKRNQWWWLLAGMLIGLSALARTQILLFVPAAAGWVFFVTRSATDDRQHRTGFRALALLLAPVVALLAVSTIRNWRVSGEWVLVSTNAGINYYVGNGPKADGITAVPVGPRWDRLLRRPLQEVEGDRPVSHRAQSGFFFREVLRFARREPMRFLHLQLRKSYLFWSALEMRNNIDIYFFKRYSQLLRLGVHRLGPIGFPFGLLAPLALCAILRPPKATDQQGGHQAGRMLLVLYLLTYMIAVSTFFVCTRFRLPVVPVLICFAADGIVRGWRTISIRRSAGGGPLRPVIGSCLAFLVLGVFLNLDLGRVGDTLPSPRDHFNLAQAEMMRGELSPSMAAVRQGLDLDPDEPDLHYLSGSIFLRQGKTSKALSAFRRSTFLDPDHALSHFELGKLHQKAGRLQPAAKAFRRATLTDPSILNAHIALGTMSLRLGDLRQAVESYRAALSLNPNLEIVRRKLVEVQAELRRKTGQNGTKTP